MTKQFEAPDISSTEWRHCYQKDERKRLAIIHRTLTKADFSFLSKIQRSLSLRDVFAALGINREPRIISPIDLKRKSETSALRL